MDASRTVAGGAVVERATLSRLGPTVAPGHLTEVGLPAGVSRIVLVRGSDAPGRSRWLNR